MVVGHGEIEEDKEQLPLEDASVVEWVSEFPYYGFLVAENGRSRINVDKRIENAVRAFGVLRRAVFKGCRLSVVTKKIVHNACVLSASVAVWQ
jgi:hypothetical protein